MTFLGLTLNMVSIDDTNFLALFGTGTARNSWISFFYWRCSIILNCWISITDVLLSTMGNIKSQYTRQARYCSAIVDATTDPINEY